MFSCDLTPHGKSRKVYTLREPLLGVISAITPFNHPLNQVAHKVAPSIATNNRMVLKPTEKTPLSALAARRHPVRSRPAAARCCRSSPATRARSPTRCSPIPTSTSSRSPAASPIGKYIAAKAGYRRQVLELGGNDPIIVMEDADLDEAATLAAAGLVQELRPALHRGQADARARDASPTRSSSALRREDASAWTLRRSDRIARSTWAR